MTKLQTIAATDIGAIAITWQGNGNAYVQAADGYAPEGAREPIDIGRGMHGSINAHFKLTNGAWAPAAPASTYVTIRREAGGDATTTQREKVIAAVIGALAEYGTAELLDDAQRARNATEAEQRHETAAK